jgi:hypothetical protein
LSTSVSATFSGIESKKHFVALTARQFESHCLKELRVRTSFKEIQHFQFLMFSNPRLGVEQEKNGSTEFL